MKGDKAHFDYDCCYNLQFLSYVVFHQQLEITIRKSSAPILKKSPKNLKSASPLFLSTLEIFQPIPPPPAPHRKRERTLWSLL